MWDPEYIQTSDLSIWGPLDFSELRELSQILPKVRKSFSLVSGVTSLCRSSVQSFLRMIIWRFLISDYHFFSFLLTPSPSSSSPSSFVNYLIISFVVLILDLFSFFISVLILLKTITIIVCTLYFYIRTYIIQISLSSLLFLKFGSRSLKIFLVIINLFS